jgi:TfoX/Sxy family transcriptional regulator of competence genes
VAFDELIAGRVRKAMGRTAGLAERKMFGGLAFLLNGNLCCGVLGRRLVLKLGNESAADALKEKHTRAMDFTGRKMKSLIYVEPKGFAAEADLKRWIRLAILHAGKLPAK